MIHLVDLKDVKEESLRDGFGRGLLKAGQINESVVGVCADLTGSTKMDAFAKAFPERFIEVGVAEQNLVTVGSGLAAGGTIPFVSSYATFSPGRNWEQIRTTICLNDQPVKIIGSHAGVSVGPDGATHQMLEDIAITRALPNMVVVSPCDSVEAEKATLALVTNKKPSYMRLARAKTPIITTDKTTFGLGKAYIFKPGKDITIIATGTMVYHALKAAEILEKDDIDAEVINCPTIKPLDAVTILLSVKKTGRVVTVEEHQIMGGLGGAIAEFLGEHHPAKMKRIGIKDRFGESGEPNELIEHFGLTGKHIAAQAHHLL